MDRIRFKKVISLCLVSMCLMVPEVLAVRPCMKGESPSKQQIFEATSLNQRYNDELDKLAVAAASDLENTEYNTKLADKLKLQISKAGEMQNIWRSVRVRTYMGADYVA